MLKTNFSESAIKDFVQTYGPITVKNLKNRTGFPKSVINSILYKNRHYMKTERSPSSYRNKKPIWSWSDKKVPLPETRKFRVVSSLETETIYDNQSHAASSP